MKRSNPDSSKKSSFTQTILSNIQITKDKKLAEKEKSSKKAKLSKINKEIDIDYEKSKLKSDILKFNTEGYVVINENDLEKDIIDISLSKGTNVRRTWQSSPEKPFFCINSLEIFNILLVAINQEGVRLTTQHEVAASSVKYYSKVSISDLIRFIGIYILLENMYGNSTPTQEENFIKLKVGEEFSMGKHRYEAIKKCIKPDNDTFDKLIEEWVSQSKSHWIPGTEVTVDESIYAYEIRPEKKKEYIQAHDAAPMHFIPRKPHKNGLLAWVMATKSYETNKPFVLDIIPHYKYYYYDL
jgi:hypothetical protein